MIGRFNEPRPLGELPSDSSGQLITEWVLLTAIVIVPLILLVPLSLSMIHVYFYRVAEIVSGPFP